jgi:hypothetical protein
LLYFEEAEEVSVRVRATDNTGHESDWRVLTTGPVSNWIYLPHVAK